MSCRVYSCVSSQTAPVPYYVIRAAQQKDLEGLAEVLADSFHSRTGWMHWVYPLLRLGIYEDLRHQLHSPSSHYICLVAAIQANLPNTTGSRRKPDEFKIGRWEGNPDNLGTRVLGTVEMTLHASKYLTHPQIGSFPNSSQYPYISNLAVKTECRRQGVARQLLGNCEQTALDWGFGDIYLHVLENNHRARRLYFNMGYRLQQVECGWSCLLLGHPQRLFLRKRLTK